MGANMRLSYITFSEKQEYFKISGVLAARIICSACE